MKTIKTISLLLLMIALINCASTTVIKTTDKDVKIYVNQEYVGKGQVTHTDTRIVGSRNLVTLKKKGCEDQTYSFSRDEAFSAGACAGGVFFLVPFLWVMKYKPARTYEFECKAN